LNKRGGSC
jgi:hypothetical protein